MIRKFEDKDMKFLQEQDMIASLEIQYHGDIIKDQIFTLADENDDPMGVLYFRYHFSWYGKNEDYNCITPCIITAVNDAGNELLKYSIKWFSEQDELCKEKKAALALWSDDKDLNEIQQRMKLGFMEYSVCPCLAFDFNDPVPDYPVPEGMKIVELPHKPEDFNKFVAMTEQANNGTPDSINDMWFFTGEPTYKIYVLMNGEDIVSSASAWRIEDGRSAIENIVTSLDYRRKGYGRVIIAYVLKRIKEQGYTKATLSMRGRNYKAHKLYQSMGFKLFYNQIELIYPGKL